MSASSERCRDGSQPRRRRRRAANAHPASRGRNFIARHWRGEYPLWVSFWIFGVLLNILASIADTAFVELPIQAALYHPFPIIALPLGLWLFQLALVLWQGLGIWRSADRYTAERQAARRGFGWAIIVKVLLTLLAMANLALLMLIGVPGLVDSTKMALLGDPDIPPFAIRLMRNGTELELSGGFKFGMDGELRRILDANPSVRVVHLTSGGGRLGESALVFETIRERGLETYVSTHCESACSEAFAAGSRRWLLENTQFIGFHSPSGVGMTEADIERMSREMIERLTSIGIDEAFIRRGLAVPSDNMIYPTQAHMLEANYATDVAPPNQFAASGYGAGLGFDAGITLEQFGEVLVAGYSYLEGPQTFRPDDFADLARDVRAAYLAGATDREVRRELGFAAIRVAWRMEHLADNRTVQSAARLLVAEYAALRSVDPTLCYRYATGAENSDTLRQHFTATLGRDEVSTMQAVFQTLGNRVVAEAPARYWSDFNARLAERLGPRSVALFDLSNVPPDRHGEYCDGLVAYFEELLDLPADQSFTLLRQVLRDRWGLH